MKDGLVHLCFVIDESGSMYNSVNDVVGGFKELIEKQKADTEGQCIVSVYRFAGKVNKDYIGRDVHEIQELEYHPMGSTALFDAVGTAIDEIGNYLRNMKEEDRPSKNIIVIMTDGEENSSYMYNTPQVKEMIEHQTNKYDWDFIYLGTELADFDDANNLGIRTRSLSGRENVYRNYNHISSYASALKCASSVADREIAYSCLTDELEADTSDYLNK